MEALIIYPALAPTHSVITALLAVINATVPAESVRVYVGFHASRGPKLRHIGLILFDGPI